MHGSRKPILITLTTLLLALPVAADQSIPETGMALEPGPDGAYGLPLLERRAPVPLELDLGDAPFRLAALSFDRERRSIRATFRHTGSAPVTAWAVELAAFAGEQSVGSSVLTQDWYQSAEEDLSSRAAAERLRRPEHEGGAFFPGQTQAVELGLTVPAPEVSPSRARLRLSIPVAVFADTSFAGSPRLAREILGTRAAAADELAYWSVRLEELLANAGSERELSRAVAKLRQELAGEAPDLPPSAQAIRANLLQNLPGAGRVQSFGGSIVTEVQSLASWLRTELRQDLRHVPSELPVDPSPPRDGGRLREKTHGDGETDPDEDLCDCGGDLFAAVTQSESVVCNSTVGWSVNESWSFTCRDGEGRTMNSSSGALNGTGGCVAGIFCFPDTYCPPRFVGPSIWDTEDEHVWNRTVTSYSVAVGICTARCVISDSSTLSHRCACMPRPAPSCSFDSCPVLIETGAGGFALTDLEGGVAFDLDADGAPERLSWPVSDTDDAWLALDRDGNGSIDDGTELFGNATPQPASDEPNGFLALAVFDRPEHGGNSDGQISAADAVFPELRLWLDRDHDGLSAPSELSDLESAGIVAIELEYRESRRRDQHGNRFRYAAGVWHASGARRLAVDVFLLDE